jgi:hypothetical protein
MGCKLSSFAFGLTVQDHYEELSDHLQLKDDGSCIKAATDDVIIVLKGKMDDETALYRSVTEVRDLLNSAVDKIGLTFINDKEQLLLPKDWNPRADLLPPEMHKNAIRSSRLEDIKLQGMEIVGTPIGSNAFSKAFVKKIFKKMALESTTLLQLHPQCAVKLLKECVCAQPSYLAQVCHPNLTVESLSTFDALVWNLFRKMLGGIGEQKDQLNCCTEGLQRARTRAFLPSRHNGVGLQSAERTASFAWFCSMASCIGLEDRDLDFARKFLGERALDAYDHAMDALGGPDRAQKCKFTLVPPGDRDVLSNSNFYVELFKDEKTLKLQHEFLEEVCILENQKFITTRRSDHPHITDSENLDVVPRTRRQQRTNPPTRLIHRQPCTIRRPHDED